MYEGVYSFSLKVSLFSFTHISLARVSHTVYLTFRIGRTNQNYLVNFTIQCAIFILDSKTRKRLDDSLPPDLHPSTFLLLPDSEEVCEGSLQARDLLFDIGKYTELWAV